MEKILSRVKIVEKKLTVKFQFGVAQKSVKIKSDHIIIFVSQVAHDYNDVNERIRV